MYYLQFLGCHVGGVDWTLGKSAEATVRVEIDLVWSTMLEQGFDLANDEIDRLDLCRAWIAYSQANFLIGRQVTQHFHAPSPLGGVLQNQLLYLHAAEIGDERIIGALQQDGLLATPVATTDVQ